MWQWQFRSLAERAGMGDIKAMLRLGESFRGALPAAYLRLEAEWEENPGQKEDELADYLENHGEDAFNARAGILWYLRAEAYGSAPDGGGFRCFRRNFSSPDRISASVSGEAS